MTQTPMGTVHWLGVRDSDRSKPMITVKDVEITADNGLVNDRYNKGVGPRQVTLFQMEHLDTIAKLMGLAKVEPSATRRNIGVAGINLLSLVDSEFQIGECILRATGDCAPCNRMNTTVGQGASKVMEGMGGITAQVVQPGIVKIGDVVRQI